MSGKKVESQTEIDEAEDEPLHSGGETEGSDFVPSDDELLKKRAKKDARHCDRPKKRRQKYGAEKIKRGGTKWPETKTYWHRCGCEPDCRNNDSSRGRIPYVDCRSDNVEGSQKRSSCASL